MVYRHISADPKCRALQLFAEGEVLGISKRSFDRWYDNYEVHGNASVDPRSVNRGRRRLLTHRMLLKTCRNYFSRHPTSMLSSVEGVIPMPEFCHDLRTFSGRLVSLGIIVDYKSFR
jgi:hypothetical protein